MCADPARNYMAAAMSPSSTRTPLSSSHHNPSITSILVISDIGSLCTQISSGMVVQQYVSDHWRRKQI
ncbi:hypothetical protein GUJ93_ZPchr0003g18400 [Zizania palustris]|uniref:Uncharacterized protein n=1 Tax=Zizania palustris TaxID=103762 RepID=A0A8J5SGJ3_ZIZPA|nr:hypothetical protein GUJ93_ZPchr0003g18400 [Zizania palustris]